MSGHMQRANVNGTDLGLLIRAYLSAHPEVSGLKGLATVVGMSYDALQKYAKGANRPPAAKLQALLTIIDPAQKILEIDPSLFAGRTKEEPSVDRANGHVNQSTSDNETFSLNSREKALEENQQSDSASLNDLNLVDHLGSMQPQKASVTSIETGMGEPNLARPALTNKALRDFVAQSSISDSTHADNEIFIPVHGFIRFTAEEMEIINHPAFQRLGEIYQLGQSHLVYRGATHKRIEHVLGAVQVVEDIADAIADNHERLSRSQNFGIGSQLCRALTDQERVFTRLGALLHDIGHLPAGHTLEDELLLLPKHDEVKRLDLVLDRTDWPGSMSPPLREVINAQYTRFLDEAGFTPVEMLYQIIAKNPSKDFESSEGFRIQVCRDIVGNTICADILDYLHRDWYHIGKPKYLDKRLFQYMEIRENAEGKAQFLISLGERSRPKTDAISAILDLLESRYQLAETVLFHRTKCSAAAMLERAIQELRESFDNSEQKQWTDGLETKLLDYSDIGVLKTLLQEAETRSCDPAIHCLMNLRNRRIYKTIYTTFHGERMASIAKRLQQTYSTSQDAPKHRLDAVRMLEDNFDLPKGTVAMYCPNRGMNAKIAQVHIHMDGVVDTFADWDKDEATLAGGHLSAQIVRFTRLWRVHICLRNEEWVKMDAPIRHLFYRAAKELVLGIHDFPVDKAAYDLALTASLTPGSPYYNQRIRDHAKAARRERIQNYPSGAPSLKSFFSSEE